MSNIFLPPVGGTIPNPAHYKVIYNHDENGNVIEVKYDLDFEKVGFSNDFFKKRMASADLKTIDFKVMDYLFYNLVKDEDIVTLNPTIILRYIPRGRSAISESIKRLIQEGYIAKIPGRCKYQINPLLLFKGNRINYLENINPSLVKRVM